eukprot:201020-Amphidinium_carterae.1
MRCVRDHFKPHVPELAQLLIEAFGQHQHSSYCYQAEILASEFKSDPEVQPVLTGHNGAEPSPPPSAKVSCHVFKCQPTRH